MPWGVLVLALDGTVALLNPKAEALWGVPLASVIGYRPARVQPAVLPPDMLCALERATRVPLTPATGEYWLPYTRQWVSLCTALTSDGHVWVYWDNVTASRQLADQHRRLQEEQQRKAASEALLRAAETAACTGSYEADLATMTFHFSDGMFRLFGEEPHAFTPTLAYIDARSWPEDAVLVKAVLDQALLDRKPYYYTRRVYRADGELRMLESHGYVVCDEAGTPVKLLGQVQDVTERKIAEAKLAQASHTIQRMLDGSIAAIVLLDALRDEQGHIVDFIFRGANKPSEVINKKTEAELLGKRLLDEFPRVRAVLFDRYLHVMETGKALRLEVYYPLNQAGTWLDVTATRNGEGLILTYLDITGRKQAEQDLHKQLQILQQAEEVARMGSWEYDLTTDVLHWSQGMYRLFELPLGSTVHPEVYLDYVLAEDAPVAQQLVEKIRTGQAFDEEVLRIEVHEKLLTLKLKGLVQHDQQGQARRLLGLDLNVSKVRQLEDENVRMRLQQQRTLFAAVLEAQEAERTRIAESLHNGIGQLLCATKLQLEHLHSTTTDAAWARADELLADAMQQTRALSHELVPAVLTALGLEAALLDITRQLSSAQLRFTCSVALEAAEPPLSQTLQVALFRMAQELAQNVVKHAQATEASLELETTAGVVLLRVEDNGVGFAAAPASSTGIGLRTIRDRVALLGGTLDIGASPTYGTYVRLRIPLS